MTKPDLTPPAASGAAPADIAEHALLRISLNIYGDTPAQAIAGDALRDIKRAALASREASPAPLTDEQITRLAKFHCGGVNTTWSFFDGGLIEFARAIAALASPQVAPEGDARDAALWRAHVAKLDALVTYCPTCCQGFTALPEMSRDEVIFECGKTAGRAAAPVQVAPTQRNTMRDFEAWYCSDGNYEPEELDKLPGGTCYANADTENMWQAWQGAFPHAATPMQAPAAADDARDAARYRKLQQEARRHYVEFDDQYFASADALDVGVDELPTPAAKPAEEQGS